RYNTVIFRAISLTINCSFSRDLASNKYSDIPDFAFVKLIRLQKLAIGGRYLTRLKEKSFRQLPFLEEL
ncbi:hypothetical protein TrispH2_008136, partial [Trichoplax sp. H2]